MDLLHKRSGINITKDIQINSGWYVIPHDIENRFEFPSKDGLLLSAFCLNDDFGNEEVLVIDNTSVNNSEVFTEDILKRCMFISHNADHEARWGVATNFIPGRYVCTMVNDKRLLSGQDGYRFDLISVINRRLGYEYIPPFMEKDIRNEFKDCKFFFDYHILYNAADTIRLKDVYYKQLEEAAKLNQEFLHKTLNSRIIIPIAKAEVFGIKHDSQKWLEIARDRKDKADKLCQELDQIITNQYQVLPETINPILKKKKVQGEKQHQRLEQRKEKLQNQLRNLESKNKTHLKSYVVTLEQLDKLSSIKPDLEKGELGINWASQKQVLQVLKEVNCPIPQAKDKKTHKLKEGLGKEARALWFVENEASIYYGFFTKYDLYKKLIHNVTSFGERWVEQYVRNGRVYTLFDQAGTDTGRWTCGSKGLVKEYPNLSQIPKPREYRECFLADDDRSLVTCDYKNQEGVIIISLSNDMEMKKITEEKDQHSALGTEAWRAVYNYRYNITEDEKWKLLAENYTMDKSNPEKEKERDKFKNSAGLFPILYGSQPAKVAATAQVTSKEAQIMIDVILNHAPQAWDYLNSKSKEASTQGYVKHNDRSGSRRWFQAVLDNKHYGSSLSKSQIVEIEMAGRNSPVQGTGSDIMKEAIAMIECWNNIYKQDIRFVLSNYDEYVASVPIEKQEQYANVIQQFMQKAANNYLIKEVQMETSCDIQPYWSK